MMKKRNILSGSSRHIKFQKAFNGKYKESLFAKKNICI